MIFKIKLIKLFQSKLKLFKLKKLKIRMPQKYYSKLQTPSLTEEEIKEKYEEIQDEMKEVLKWKKEEETKLKDVKASPQKKAAVNRALKKIARRIDTVNGQTIYWKMRMAGESHFKASLEKNEYWARCNERNNSK
jgi:hypothetical protein